MSRPNLAVQESNRFKPLPQRTLAGWIYFTAPA